MVTGEMVEELILSGADIIKVGVGPGETCREHRRADWGAGALGLGAPGRRLCGNHRVLTSVFKAHSSGRSNLPHEAPKIPMNCSLVTSGTSYESRHVVLW